MVEINVIKSVFIADRIAATIPKTVTIIRLGIKTVKLCPTAGGTIGPKLILNAFTLENLIKSSVASNPTIMPPNMLLVPILSYKTALVIVTATLEPTGTVLKLIASKANKEAKDTGIQPIGFSYPLFLAKK